MRTPTFCYDAFELAILAPAPLFNLYEQNIYVQFNFNQAQKYRHLNNNQDTQYGFQKLVPLRMELP